MAKGLKAAKEWYKQADYDFDTAKALYEKKKYIYCIFFCHLAVEKALKGLYTKKMKKEPAKTHNLLYFIEASKLQPEQEILTFIVDLNNLSVPTRYPDVLSKMHKDFHKKRTKEMLMKSKGVIKWVKKD